MTKEERFTKEQRRLQTLLMKSGTFDEAIDLCVAQNGQLHESRDGATIGDDLVADLDPETFRFRPEGEFESIAWAIWHVTRIEDAIGNLVIAGKAQVFDDSWKRRIGVTVSDTGNAFSRADVDSFGRSANMEQLLRYRREVGKRSREIIGKVRQEDLRRRPDKSRIEMVISQGVLTKQKESYWLRDFWAGKTMAGLLLLPMTRHQMMHIPNCLRIKELMANGRP